SSTTLFFLLFSFLVFSMILPPPRFTLFPYTTLFRSAFALAWLPVQSRSDDATSIAIENTLPGTPGWLGPDVTGSAAEVYASATEDRKSTRLNSSHQIISYAVFCLKKKKTLHKINNIR